MKFSRGFQFLLCTLLISCGAIVKEQKLESCHKVYKCLSSSGEIVKWPENSKINIKFASSFSQDDLGAFSDIIDEYNGLFDKITFTMDTTNRLKDENNPDNVAFDGTNGIYVITGEWPWKDKHPNASAVTVPNIENGEITGFDIFFRAEYLTKYTSDKATSRSRSNAMNILFRHELGHGMGLYHNDTVSSFMFPQLTVNSENANYSYSQEDLKFFATAYSITAPNNSSIENVAMVSSHHKICRH